MRAALPSSGPNTPRSLSCSSELFPRAIVSSTVSPPPVSPWLSPEVDDFVEGKSSSRPTHSCLPCVPRAVAGSAHTHPDTGQPGRRGSEHLRTCSRRRKGLLAADPSRSLHTAVSSMLPGHGSVLQALLGTFFTWGMTAAGAALVFVFSSGQVSCLDSLRAARQGGRPVSAAGRAPWLWAPLVPRPPVLPPSPHQPWRAGVYSFGITCFSPDRRPVVEPPSALCLISISHVVSLRLVQVMRLTDE